MQPKLKGSFDSQPMDSPCLHRLLRPLEVLTHQEKKLN